MLTYLPYCCCRKRMCCPAAMERALTLTTATSTPWTRITSPSSHVRRVLLCMSCSPSMRLAVSEAGVPAAHHPPAPLPPLPPFCFVYWAPPSNECVCECSVPFHTCRLSCSGPRQPGGTDDGGCWPQPHVQIQSHAHREQANPNQVGTPSGLAVALDGATSLRPDAPLRVPLRIACHLPTGSTSPPRTRSASIGSHTSTCPQASCQRAAFARPSMNA
jgi:hypothetical protein